MDYRNHVNSADDLITSYEETRAGFINMALEKNREATPYIAEAKAIKAMSAKYHVPKELLNNQELISPLLTAAGVSDKANAYLTDEDRIKAIQAFIENFLEPSGKDFVDEFVFRFLLTRGDSLGGKMRNIAGRLAERKVIRTLVANLSIAGKPFSWLEKETLNWVSGDKDNANIEFQTRGLHWKNGKNNRVLLLNLSVPFVGSKGNNVDMCLLEVAPEKIILKGTKTRESIHREPDFYLALGELKGGIDPAGADEHWKTARAAIDRIRNSFSKKNFSPELFYIGAAIQAAMAEEIYNQLQSGKIHNAANLTADEQNNSLCKWLIEI